MAQIKCIMQGFWRVAFKCVNRNSGSLLGLKMAEK